MAKKQTEEMIVKPDATMAQYDYGDDTGKGQSGITPDDLIVPQVFILQEKNKHLKELDEAEVGWFYNSVSETASEDLVGVIVDKAIREFVEWYPRDSKKGVAGRHAVGTPIFEKYKNSFGRVTLDSGNELIDTYKVPMALEDGSFCFLNISSTCITPYKKFFTRLTLWQNTNGRPPSFAVKVKVTTKTKSNPKGDSMIPVFEGVVSNNFKLSLISPTDQLYQTGKQLFQMMEKGLVRASEETADVTEEEKSPLE